MKKLFLTGILFLFSAAGILAQREANIWYFGEYAGIDFNSGTAIPLLDGKINRWEGVASICDSLGNLLFYTDGDSVWNREHYVMPNGGGLNGEPSSTESAIIIPYPEHDSLYFIFTVDAEGGDDGLCYSIVNMNKNNGLGDVVLKNDSLIAPVSEKITAVRHANNRDFWVIAHGWETDSFLVYLVTPSGINLPPQIFEIGTPHDDIGLHGNNAVGYMRAAPDGSKIALALQVRQIFEIYDFDNSTGVISNPVTIPDYGGSPYGVEFSADVSKLYMTSRFYLYQADLSSGNATDIINSVVFIDSSQTANFFGAVQLATDGKIYLAHEYSDYLGVVNNPEKKGDSCNFELYGLYLDGRKSRMGLPDFIQTYFLPPDIKVKNYCFGDTTMFYFADTTGLDSVFWSFSDTVNNQASGFYAKHKFSSTGRFEVVAEIWRNGSKYIKTRIIQINPLPEINIGNDTLICFGDSVILQAFCDDCLFLWQDSSTTANYVAKNDTVYFVKATNKYTGCFSTDSFSLSLSPLPEFQPMQDTGFCAGDSVLIGFSDMNYSFRWSNGSTDKAIFVSNEGIYTVRITDTLNCENSDTVFVSEYALPEFFIGNDTIICPGTTINLMPDNYAEIYEWNTGDTTRRITVTDAGMYFLTETDENNCKNSDTIIISPKAIPEINLPSDTVLCENEILEITANPPDCEYLWSDGTTEDTFTTTESGDYWLRAENICGTDTAYFSVYFEYCGELYIPNIFTPNNDGKNEFFAIKGLDEGWELYIYDRLGNLVYYSADYKNDWNGEDCPDGVYYFVLNKTAINERYSGFVRVYR